MATSCSFLKRSPPVAIGGPVQALQKLQPDVAKMLQNQCLRSRAVSRLVWTPFCVILWGWLSPASQVVSCISGGRDIVRRGKCLLSRDDE